MDVKRDEDDVLDGVDQKTGLPEDIVRGMEALGLNPDGSGGDGEDGEDDERYGEEDDSDDGDIGEDALINETFANEENKKLDLLVKAKEKKLAEIDDKLEENTTRVGIMIDHLKNVEQELLHTQSLVDTKTKEISTEKHIKRLATIEIERLEALSKEYLAQITKDNEKLHIIQGEQFSSNEKLEKFRMQMNWNQEELLQWSLAAKQKEEDRLAVERYKLADDKRIKHLIILKEKVTKEMQKKKATLETEITETQAVQIELNKTADEYKKTHFDRQGLIKQWNDAVRAMQKRDEEIKDAKEDVAAIRAELRRQAKTLSKQKVFLDQEKINNQQVQAEIDVSKRNNEKRRLELQKTKKDLVDLEEEFTAIRNELLQAQSDLNKNIEMNEQLRINQESKTIQRERLETTLEEKKKEIEQFLTLTENIAAKSRKIEKLHDDTKQLLDGKFKEAEQVKNDLFKAKEQLTQARQVKKNCETDIASAQRTSKILTSKISNLDQASLKMQEMLYTTEFQVQQMERKLDRASGKRSFQETEALNKLIRELHEQMEVEEKGKMHMMNQVKRLETDVKIAERESNTQIASRAKLKERLHSIELETASRERELKQTKEATNTKTMEHDVLKLEVTKLKDKMAEVSQRIVELRGAKMEIELQMRTRKEELKSFEEIQRGKLRVAEEARHEVAVDFKERQLKAVKLQQKYETIHAKLQSNDEEPKTQAYYIIQVAQEREELQNKGDKLNNSIKKAEKDIRMLSKALLKLNKRNEKYKSMLNKADSNGAEYELKEKLEEQHRSVADALFAKKAHLKDIQTENDENKHGLTRAINDIARMQQEIKSEQKEQILLESQLTQQDVQHERVSSELEAINQQLKKSFPGRRGVVEYIEYLHLKQKNRAMLDIFANLAQDVPMIGEDGLQNIISKTLSTLGVPLSRPTSREFRPGSREIKRIGESKTALPTVQIGSGFAKHHRSGRGSKPGSFRAGGIKVNSRPGTGSRTFSRPRSRAKLA